MKKIIIVVIIVLVVILGAVYIMHKDSDMQGMNMQPASQSQSSSTNTAKPAGKNAVTIENFAFSPATITIKAGQSITWTNEDSIGHSATADDNSWDTGVLPQGQSKAITFAKAGTYTYHCSVHPNMKATVVVQ
jgi:plastocyanin